MREGLRELINKWRGQSGMYDEGSSATYHECADELEAALEAEKEHYGCGCPVKPDEHYCPIHRKPIIVIPTGLGR